LLLGAHVSISGGFYHAPLRGQELGCNTIQIFTKNANQWKAREILPGEIEKFQESLISSNIAPVVAHDSYLINLASPDNELWKKSLRAFLEEMERAESLKIPYLVTHPGSHKDAGEDEGLKKLIESFNSLHRDTKGFRLTILLETTAGQGSALGYRFEHIGEIINHMKEPDRIGVCFDTCHTYAAGYNIKEEKGYYQTWEDFNRIIGLSKLRVIHLNDCKKDLGSRVDRHEHIGKGDLGLEFFNRLLHDQRFQNIPMILETPGGQPEHKMNLETLKALVA
jgi:deoxyribonuclease-4